MALGVAKMTAKLIELDGVAYASVMTMLSLVFAGRVGCCTQANAHTTRSLVAIVVMITGPVHICNGLRGMRERLRKGQVRGRTGLVHIAGTDNAGCPAVALTSLGYHVVSTSSSIMCSIKLGSRS